MKIWAFILRLFDILKLFPKRLQRLIRHIFRNPFKSPLIYLLDIIFLCIDLLGLPEIYESFSAFFKWNTRFLTAHEIEMAQSIFGNSINYSRVRIDNKAYFGPKQKHFAYVSFYTINYWGDIQDRTFIHEMTHVWQYEKMGAKYIPHALMAQRTQEGYDYGGIDGINQYLGNGKRLKDFNLEQQGDVVADYYTLKNKIQNGMIALSSMEIDSFERIIGTM